MKGCGVYSRVSFVYTCPCALSQVTCDTESIFANACLSIYTAPMRHIRLGFVLIALCLMVFRGQAQTPWQMQDSGVTVALRGIHAVNGNVAWASGAGGTVLRTTDGGAHWQKCSTPDAQADGATLDFRGLQAWNANTAVVMSSGPGDKSRLYKTTNGCRSWQLLFVNPDAPQGFFDSFWFNGPRGIVLGDPVEGRFVVYVTTNRGKHWKRDRLPGLALDNRTLAAFAASNSSIAKGNNLFARCFATGGKSGAVFFTRPFTAEEEKHGIFDLLLRKKTPWRSSAIPLASGTETSGAFAVAYRYPVTTGLCPTCGFGDNSRFIAVGGDYTKPNASAGTAAWSADGGVNWTPSAVLPHGYRSAVEWSAALNVWITAGANGSDVSRDEGKTWQPLDDGNWNALSLPFAVGPNGRIARLDANAIKRY
jgi:photosystem II stability/assembly factor-like uncharacterized protein